MLEHLSKYRKDSVTSSGCEFPSHQPDVAPAVHHALNSASSYFGGDFPLEKKLSARNQPDGIKRAPERSPRAVEQLLLLLLLLLLDCSCCFCASSAPENWRSTVFSGLSLFNFSFLSFPFLCSFLHLGLSLWSSALEH